MKYADVLREVMEGERTHVVGIPLEVLHNPTITLRAKVLLGEIRSLSMDGRKCVASNRHLAFVCGCSVQRIADTLTALRKRGYIGAYDCASAKTGRILVVKMGSIRRDFTRFLEENGALLENKNPPLLENKNPPS